VSAGGSRIGRNALSLGLGTVLASLFVIVQMKVFTLSLPPEDYALLLALRALAGIVTALAVMGLPQVATRFLPQLEVRREKGPLLRFSGALLGLLLLSSLLALVLAWWTRGALMRHFDLGMEAERFFGLTLLLAFSMGINELALNLFQGIRRMGWVALAQVLTHGLLALHLYLVRAALDPELALLLFSVYFLVPGVLLLVLFPFLLPSGGSGQRPLRLSRGELGGYWRLGLLLRWMVLASLDLDRYFLSFFASMELIAFFNIPARIVTVSRRFLQASITALQTEVSRLHEERREDDLPERLQFFLRGQVGLSLWMGAVMLLLARPMILAVSTEDYLAGLPLLAILLLTLPLSSLSSPMEAAFRGTRGLGKILAGNLLWAAAYFASFPFLVKAMGLPGLGLAQVGALSLQALWMLVMGRRQGWLGGCWPLLASLLAAAAPVAAALAAALLLPGREGMVPSTAGSLAGCAVLAAGVLVVLRGRRYLLAREKLWLRERFGRGALRGLLTRLLNLEAS